MKKDYTIAVAGTGYDLVAECGAGIYIYTCDAVIPSVYNLLESHKLEEMVYYAGKKKRLVDINGFLVTPFNGEIIKQKSIVSILIKRNELPIYVYKRIMNYRSIRDSKESSVLGVI